MASAAAERPVPRELRALLAPEGQQQCRKWHHQLIAERLPAGDMKAMDEALLLEAARRLDLGVGELGARVQQHHVLDVFDAFGMAEEHVEETGTMRVEEFCLFVALVTASQCGGGRELIERLGRYLFAALARRPAGLAEAKPVPLESALLLARLYGLEEDAIVATVAECGLSVSSTLPVDIFLKLCERLFTHPALPRPRRKGPTLACCAVL